MIDRSRINNNDNWRPPLWLNKFLTYFIGDFERSWIGIMQRH